MPNRRTCLIGFLALLIITVAGGLAWWLAHRPPAGATPTPLPTAPPFTPPPSLDELAGLYPGIADLLADAKLGSVYKEFLVAYQQGGLAAAEELARQRGLLTDQDELRLLLVLDSDDPDPLVAQLQAAGVRVENYYGDLVAVAVPLARIEAAAQAGDPGAALRPLTELEHVIEIRLPESAIPQAGPVVGEGVAVVGADAWHAAGYTGQGVKVAILDSSFEGYEGLLGSELPDRVVYKTFGRESGVHGAACAEIVHEVAPDAELYLVAYDGEIGFGQAVDWLIAQDVDVVSYSMSWLVGPRDGASRQAQLVDKAHDAGILWAGSSGNYAQSHYAALFTDADGDGLHEFSPGQEMLSFFLEEPDEVSIALNWDDWPRSDQDLDLYLMDAAGDVLASSRDTQSGAQSPAEWIWYDLDAGVYYLVIEAAATSRAVYLDLFTTDGVLEQPVAEGSLGTPADARGGLAVGATYWENDSLERFSSQGPTADGRIKPDLAAPDGVKGVSYGRFGGTSAAAPHVAGAAALVLSAFPGASPDDVATYLQGSALDLGPPGMDNGYGAGRLALGALPSNTTSSPEPTAIAPAPSPTLMPPTSPTAGPTPTPPTVAAPVRRKHSANVLLLFGLGLAILFFTAMFLWSFAGHTFRRIQARLPWDRRKGQYCSRCGRPQRMGARFCGTCGAAMGTPLHRCPACNQLVFTDQARFCGRCGHELDT